MPMKLLSIITPLLIGAPAAAQELSVEVAAPLVGELMMYSGQFSANQSIVESGYCPKGEAGNRQQSAEVRFEPPFREAPQVLVSLNILNFDLFDEEPRDLRIRARARNVTREGMTIVVETWCDTNMYRAAGTFFAMGELGESSSEESARPSPAPPDQPAPPVILEQLGPPPEEEDLDTLDGW